MSMENITNAAEESTRGITNTANETEILVMNFENVNVEAKKNKDMADTMTAVTEKFRVSDAGDEIFDSEKELEVQIKKYGKALSV